jgi:hypothetical protein
MHLHASFDLDELPEDDAKTIKDLLDESDFFELPELLQGLANVPDQFTYKVAVESKKGQHAVTMGDSAIPKELQPLLDTLSYLMRTRGRA